MWHTFHFGNGGAGEGRVRWGVEVAEVAELVAELVAEVGEGVLSYTTACKYNEVLCLLAISIAKNQLYHLRPPHPPWWWRWSLASWRLVKAVYGIASVDELTTTAEHRDSAA